MRRLDRLDAKYRGCTAAPLTRWSLLRSDANPDTACKDNEIILMLVPLWGCKHADRTRVTYVGP